MADPATRLPVVFIHGIRASGTMWGPVAEMVGRERLVATPDLPGHGARRGEAFDLAGAVHAVSQAVDGLGGRALLVGLSLGGYAAIAAGAQHPGRVAGIMAIGCSAEPTGLGLAAYRLFAAAMAHDPERGNRLSRRGFDRLLPPQAAAAMAAGGFSCEVMPAVVAALGRFRPLAALRGYPGPVWLVNGGLDQFRLHERRFLAACQDGRLAVWPGLTHLSTIAATSRLARAVRDACAVIEQR
jgi:pimeloyl-ACP methyl ester carboxylesterase